jgi:aminoglycoside N3'-acetyltransferase
MSVTQLNIQQALRALGLSGHVICLHSSLRSFGHVAGGALTVVRALVDEGCTVLVPTFSSVFEVAPPSHLQFERNGWNDRAGPDPHHSSKRFYTPDVPDIDRSMGLIPATVLSSTDHLRGNHPLDSFTALGPQAALLTGPQAPLDVYEPLTTLTRMKGFVLLMGVGLERMTLIHLAEKEAGRTLFRRWANDKEGRPMTVEVGGCSEGFGKLEPHLDSVMRRTEVGKSKWTVLPANKALACAASAIRADPEITHCGIERAIDVMMQ